MIHEDNLLNAPAPSSHREQDILVMEIDNLRQRLNVDPYNVEMWRTLVSCADKCDDIEKSIEVYRVVLDRFPHTAKVQISQLRRITSQNSSYSVKEAEDLFRSYLKQSPSVELCNLYVTYIRDQHPLDLIDAHKFALRLIGHDRESYQLWNTYLLLLRKDTSVAGIQTLRKTLHEVVQTPLPNLPVVWSQLEALEYQISASKARKVLAQLSPACKRACEVLQTLDSHFEELNLPLGPQQATPFFPSQPTFSLLDRQVVGKWKNYLRWEEGDSLMLKDSNIAAFTSRVKGAYRKATIRMRYYPEIWYMAFKWFASIGNFDEALSFLRQGIAANESSFLLNFALADTLETRGENDQVQEIFENLISTLRDLLLSQNATNLRNDFGVVYIMYMRFARRANGLDAARSVFSKARKEVLLTPWPVYEAAAMMEYHCGGGKDVALKIFQAGMAIFRKDHEYLLRYLEWLISVNDQNNAQSLFEASVNILSAENARQLWDRWSRYNYHCGNLNMIQRLEQRMLLAYPTDPPMKHFGRRHSYANTDPIAAHDLGLAMATKEMARESRHRVEEKKENGTKRSVNSRIDPGGSSESDPKRIRIDDHPIIGAKDTKKSIQKIHTNRQKLPVPAALCAFLGLLPDRKTFNGPTFDVEDMLALMKTVIIPKNEGNS
ncbi:mrna 3 -end-processing protein rna14 [Moniliophthora roreri MCA 2997]|uniref:mRNA 3'-end-processing protein RNA14 n=1 Tax=Moniliophthora roreri (strain MCA 2997) TaxID=1381753 RepID=V2XAQ2_MONRO|nr:mrna 3 -end-processing protein rna14 [Moniliophthora roreri MCA 2997]